MRSLRRSLRLWDFYHPAMPGFLWLPLLALAVANWLPGLPASYAIDETGSFQLASAGPLEAFRRAVQHSPQSPLYHLILACFLWPIESPYREMVSRLPSLAGLAGATWMIYRAGERWIARGAGATAALIFATIPGVAVIGVQTRHYGLLWFAATGYLWFFWSWMAEGRRRDFWLSRLLLLIGISLNLMAGLLLAVDLLNVVLRRRFSLRYAGLTAGAAALALWPQVLKSRETVTAVGGWRYHHLFPHNIWNFDGQLPLRLTVGLLLCWVAARLIWPRVSRRVRSTEAWRVFLVTWLMVIPGALALADLRMDAWLMRYLLLASPALVLLAGDAFARLAASARVAALAPPLLAVLLSGRLLAPGGAQDFRQGAETVLDLSLYETSPLLVPSWFVEAQVADAQALYARHPALYGHLAAYPVPNPIFALPVWYSERLVPPALERLLDGPLKDHKRVLVALTPWPPWFRRTFEARGWRTRLHAVERGLYIAECTRE